MNQSKNRVKSLITGATGSEALNVLREAGQEVRALVHREDLPTRIENALRDAGAGEENSLKR